MRLIDELGFDAVDTGSLADSWKQEPGTPVYGTDLGSEATELALATASRTRPPVPTPQPRSASAR
jgi:predicted dinucleotide-binding enzyme